jgi:hypothetical protein
VDAALLHAVLQMCQHGAAEPLQAVCRRNVIYQHDAPRIMASDGCNLLSSVGHKDGQVIPSQPGSDLVLGLACRVYDCVTTHLLFKSIMIGGKS